MIGMREPLRALRADLEIVKKGQNPRHTTDDLLRLMKLDSDDRDGRSLGERLMGNSLCDRTCFPSPMDYMAVVRTVGMMKKLNEKLAT